MPNDTNAGIDEILKQFEDRVTIYHPNMDEAYSDAKALLTRREELAYKHGWNDREDDIINQTDTITGSNSLQRARLQGQIEQAKSFKELHPVTDTNHSDCKICEFIDSVYLTELKQQLKDLEGKS